MKKAKVLLAAAVLAVVGAMAFAAPKAAAPTGPFKVEISAATKWGNDATMQNETFDNGTCTYESMFKYGGGGVTFNINGKTGINLADYKTIAIEYEYKVADGWSNNAKFPKFGVKTWGQGATFYQGGIGHSYPDGDALEGSGTFEIDISAAKGKALRVGLVANSWKWTDEGGSEDDKVWITVKSITFLP